MTLGLVDGLARAKITASGTATHVAVTPPSSSRRNCRLSFSKKVRELSPCRPNVPPQRLNCCAPRAQSNPLGLRAGARGCGSL